MTVLANVTEAITLMTGTVIPGFIDIIVQPPFIYPVGIGIVFSGVVIVKKLLHR